MKSKTHIVVVRMKEIIYTAIFLIFAVLLILLLIFMFNGSHKNNTQPTISTSSTYIPGVYTSSLLLNGSVIDVSVAVDAEHINGVSLVNLEESVATMYPLLETCTDDISRQLSSNISLEDVTCDSSNQYTYQLLSQAIQKALSKASGTSPADAAIN